jgi:hypothetical protein
MSQYIIEEEPETVGLTERDIDIVRMCARERDVPFVLQLFGYSMTTEGEISRLS